MKTDDLPPASLMIGIVHLQSGKDIVDFFVRLPRLPQQFSLLHGAHNMGLCCKEVLKSRKISRKIVARRQQKISLPTACVLLFSILPQGRFPCNCPQEPEATRPLDSPAKGNSADLHEIEAHAATTHAHWFLLHAGATQVSFAAVRRSISGRDFPPGGCTPEKTLPFQ